MPYWGLTLLATSVVFLTPLLYFTNQELIDYHVSNANDIIGAQTAQVRDLAGQHAANATETFKNYAGDYTAKAQEMMGSATGNKPASTVNSEDFPKAPNAELQSTSSAASEPIAAS